MRPVFLAFMLAVLPSCDDETVKIIDGDGFRIGQTEYRLWGIDAPEFDQTCEGQNGLKDLIGNETPNCETLNKDRYGRSIARCSVNGDDLGSLMVRKGLAVDYTRYSNGHYMADRTPPKLRKSAFGKAISSCLGTFADNKIVTASRHKCAAFGCTLLMYLRRGYFRNKDIRVFDRVG